MSERKLEMQVSFENLSAGEAGSAAAELLALVVDKEDEVDKEDGVDKEGGIEASLRQKVPDSLSTH